MATFMKNVNLISRANAQFLEEKLGGGRLKGHHFRYVMAVCSNAGVSQEGLARAMFVNKSNVARQLGFLEEEGLVRREKSAEDARAYLVYPTEAALELLPRIRAVNKLWRDNITCGFTAEEVETLSRLTERLVKNAQNYLWGGR